MPDKNGIQTCKEIREKFSQMIEEEYLKTHKAVLDITEQHEILERNYALQNSIRLRNPYVDPISLLQVRFLRQRRRAQRSRVPAQWERALALTVNGIAAGMRHTG
jgi:phosphoenolpyruvate carboxylase